MIAHATPCGSQIQIERIGWSSTSDPVDLRTVAESIPGLAPIGLFEFGTYRISVTGGSTLDWSPRPDVLRLDPASCLIEFRNLLGAANLELSIGKTELVRLRFEILSRKLSLDVSEDHPLEHMGFLRRLSSRLMRSVVEMPFELSSTTEFALGTTAGPNSWLFVMSLLCARGNAVAGAIRSICRRPHRRLIGVHTVESWPTKRPPATRFLRELGQNRIRMVPAEAHDLPSRWPLIDRESRPHVPVEAPVEVAIPTSDTPENRFARIVLEGILHAAERAVRESAHSLVNHPASRIAVDATRSALLTDVFDRLPDPTGFPARSRVLTKRDDYRALLDFHLASLGARTIFPQRLTDALGARRVDQLYEYFCFFSLAAALAAHLGGIESVVPATDSTNALREGAARARFRTGAELHFNATFCSSETREPRPFESWSHSLRPDFTLTIGGRPIAAFDAKFRRNGEEESGTLPEDALNKMHAYRDALDLPAVLAIHPALGDATLYSRALGRETVAVRYVIARVLAGFSGVGVVPLVPSVEGTDDWGASA